MLTATRLCLDYGAGESVVEGVDLTLAPGEIVGLSGESGSGKTTLVRALAGLIAPRAGAVTLDGRPVDPRRADIAVVFQSPRTATNPRLTLASIIAEPLRIRRERADLTALAREVGLTPDLLTRRPHEVSDGQLQRACVARALAQRPRYLLCDEPTAMLDAATTAAIARLLTTRATTGDLGLLLVSHDRPLLDACHARVHTLTAGTLTP